MLQIGDQPGLRWAPSQPFLRLRARGRHVVARRRTRASQNGRLPPRGIWRRPARSGAGRLLQRCLEAARPLRRPRDTGLPQRPSRAPACRDAQYRARCTAGQRLRPSPTYAETPFSRAIAIRGVTRPCLSRSWTCGRRITDARTPRDAIAAVASSDALRGIIELGSGRIVFGRERGPA